MMTNFDQQLEVWLHRIGVTPYKPVGTVSPLVSKALANYCWPDAQFIIDAHIEESDGMQSLFKHCGVPNVFLAQLNSIKLVESLELFGERLCAHPQQAPIIHKTDFLPWVDFSLDSSSPIPSPIEIAQSDRDEFILVKQKVVSDRTDTFSLRHDNAFMLGHYLVEFLLWPSENSTCELAVGLQPFMNVPVTADGELYFDDGISAPGKYVEMVAEMDVVVLISNCPQINNPCSGFNPTPLEILIWD